MDFCGEIVVLLKQKNYKQLADKFYLPNSSSRPDRCPPASLLSSAFGNYSSLPVPLDSLARKYCESVKLLGVFDANLVNVSALQPILNLCREFFNEAIDHFGTESTALEQGEWLLRAATSNYIYIGLLISKAGELEVDGDERIGEVFHSIKKCLAQMNKKEESKRQIIIFLFAECFKLMFKLKRLGLFPSLLTSVQVLGADKLLPRSRRSDSCQFLFYRALYEFHSQKFRESWDRFRETWSLLHPEDWKHRRRVAVYLISIALCHGKAPTNAFLAKYNLVDEFGALRDSMLSGNSKVFKRELEGRASILHQPALNIYVFLLLNADPAIHLRLIRKTWILAGNLKILTFEQIKLVGKALNSMEISSDELECILVNLIGRGWIKGHLGHDSQCLVLSVNEPFPVILK